MIKLKKKYSIKEKEEILERSRKFFLEPLSILMNYINYEIINFCYKKDRTILELTKLVGISRINIWKHLKKLVELKIVSRKKKGRNVYISLTKYGRLSYRAYLEYIVDWGNLLEEYKAKKKK